MLARITLLLIATVYFFNPVSVLSQQSQPSFSFTITTAAKTSAGVYKIDGTLVRTLWSGEQKNAGTYKYLWDGKDDSGNALPSERYIAKILSNNVKYEWEGARIGNTSDSISGDTKLHGFDIINTMVINGNTAYCGTGYSENNSSQFKVNLSTPGKKNYLLQQYHATSQASFYTATDGVNVYWSGSADISGGGSRWFTFATNVSDDTEIRFSNGVPLQTVWGRRYLSVIDLVENANGRILGLAVQKNHKYLFVAYPYLNEIHVINKTTGEIVQNIKSFISPRQLTIDNNDDLWIISSGSMVSRHVVNNDGTLTSATLKIPELVQPLALGCNSNTLVIADGGNSQQLKAFDNTGTSLWTYGTAGGYLSDPTVKNDKFYFSDVGTNIRLPFICFQTDGSFWVSDPGNYRVQHFTANRAYLNRIMFLPHSYSIRVDKNNPTRVFNEYLEFAIDYSKKLDNGYNGSWTLVKNWRGTVKTDYYIDFMVDILRSVTTLSNDRTYALLTNQVSHKSAVVELPANEPLRYTGIEFNAWSNQTISQDGSLRSAYGQSIGDKATWYKNDLKGFDTFNNPVWGDFTVLAATTETTVNDPILGGYFSGLPNTVTSSGIIISFNGGVPTNGSTGYHLGGIKAGDNKWLWKTAMTMPGGTANRDFFPSDGRFDAGNEIARAGTLALAIDHSIIWGYGGEFWRGYQVNKFNHVYDNGLFVGQFGILGVDVWGQEAPAMMAGNSFSPEMIKIGDDYYLYHNDEFWHSGIHRWKISGINTIKEQSVPVSYPNGNAYFKSKASGAWNDTKIWSTSLDNTAWVDAQAIPDTTPNSVIIQSGHRIVITDSARIDQLVIQNGGTLNVAPNASLIVNDGLGDDISIAPLGSLVIQSDATGSGRIGNSSGNILGNVTVERYIAGSSMKSYRLLSPSVNTSMSPKPFIRDNWQEGQNNTSVKLNSNTTPKYGIQITGSTIGADGFDATSKGTASLFTYNPSSTEPSWMNALNTNATNLEAKNGYLILISGDRSNDLRANSPPSSTTLRATGSILSGTQIFTKPPGDRGTMLVSNPYASPINWNTIYNDASTSNSKNFENYYTYWDTRVGASGGYVTVNTAGITSAPTNATIEIQSGQAFLVKIKKGITTPTLIVNENHKSTNNNSNVFRIAPQEQLMSSLYFSPKVGTRILTDAVNTVFNNSYSKGADDIDADEMANSDENIAIAKNGRRLSIEGRPLVTTTDTVLLATQGLKQQRYEWQFDPAGFSRGDLQAYLEDKFLNVCTPISLTTPTIISFGVTIDLASADAHRFKIIIGNAESLATKLINFTNTPQKETKSGFDVYPNPISRGQLTVQFNDIPEGAYLMKLLNSNGQTILQKTIYHMGGSANKKFPIDARLPAGNYILQMKGNDKVFNKQILK